MIHLIHHKGFLKSKLHKILEIVLFLQYVNRVADYNTFSSLVLLSMIHVYHRSNTALWNYLCMEEQNIKKNT